MLYDFYYYILNGQIICLIGDTTALFVALKKMKNQKKKMTQRGISMTTEEESPGTVLSKSSNVSSYEFSLYFHF